MQSSLSGPIPHDELTQNALEHWDKTKTGMKPKDSATLIILDRTHGEPKMLMGRRHEKHRFMPGKFVFPGGRLDLSDRFIPYANDLHPHVMEKLRKDAKNGNSDARMRGLAMCAIRETYEEAGLFIGAKGDTSRLTNDDWAAFRERGILPNLSPLRFIARAITPPGRTRRFDTRFFAIDADHIVDRLPDGKGPTDELQELCWITIKESYDLELPRITKEVLHELETRLKIDSDFTPEVPTPFYYVKGKVMVRAEL